MGRSMSMTMVIHLHGVFLILLMNMGGVLSDPQTLLLSQDCNRQSSIRVEMSVFMRKFNKTFGEIRRQLSNNHNIHFATTVETDVYGMVQCRNYLSTEDCLACLDVAQIEVRRNCPTFDGGDVIYKGCFLSQKDCHNCLTIGYNNIKSCPPGSEGSSADAGCFLRYSDASFFADNSTISITPYLHGGTSKSRTTIIGGLVGVLCLFLILAVILWYQSVRKANVAQRGDMLGLSKLQGPVIYSFKDLKSATRNFSEDSKIGEGGYGDVYKGITKNGDVVAVKKLSIATSKAKEDFECEVRLTVNINHRNIIRLLGCSNRGSELLLVFEYMANGSLDTFLYGVKRGMLSWKQHFGLARYIRDDQSHLSTRFAGTLGYTAPEYAIHGHLSEKVDTYSFGVVVLEIVSGRRCTNLDIKPDNGSLLEHTWNLYASDRHSDLADKNLDPNAYNIDEVKKTVEIALMCTQSPTSLRPTMSEVVVLLTNDSSIKHKPEKPTIF
ncbi:hypothetical protein POM88_001516 [Heracleum sosnowskyi]|uniref:Uncharacterized protein n=1 Tax=Heracleum sosnowskyi TaxID=360622 RepID=A0AAD8NAW9_9APIA|nr:hypothetical protein POM88_001516 [Heracleum sosnowskyi]